MSADRVNLINENNARGLFFPLDKQIAYPRRAYADEHLDKIRATDGKKWHPGLTSNGPRQQGFARPRRTHQQHSFRNTPT